MQLEVVSEFAALSALQPEWDALAVRAACESPALSFAWFQAWWPAFGDGAALRALIVRDAERLLALAPLMLQRQREWGYRWRLASSCTNAHSPVGGLLVAERQQECLDLILEHWERSADSWDLLRFDYITPGTGLAALQEALQRRGLAHLVRRKRTGPVLDIDRPWEESWQQLGRGFRESTRRKVRKALDAGARVSIHTAGADVAPLLERAFAVASRSWSGRAGTALGSSAALRQFYRSLCEAAARQEALCLAFLEREGEDLAFELSLDYAGARHNLKMAYAEEHGSLSPGLVLRYHVLRDAFERGLRAFHFLGDRERHKDHWASRWEDHCRLTVYNRRLLPTARYLVSGPFRARARRSPGLSRLKRWLRRGA